MKCPICKITELIDDPNNPGKVLCCTCKKRLSQQKAELYWANRSAKNVDTDMPAPAASCPSKSSENDDDADNHSADPFSFTAAEAPGSASFAKGQSRKDTAKPAEAGGQAIALVIAVIAVTMALLAGMVYMFTLVPETGTSYHTANVENDNKNTSNDKTVSSSSNKNKAPADPASAQKPLNELDLTELLALGDELSAESDTILKTYTAESVQKYANCISKIGDLLSRDTASQREVDVLVKETKNAKDNLELRKQPVVFEGAGDDVIDIPEGYDVAIVSATHNGEHNFVIKTLDSLMETDDLLVNTIGSYQGTTLIGDGYSTARHLEISADGAWTVSIALVVDAPTAVLGQSYTGDQVLYLPDDVASKLSFSYTGEHNFVVKSIASDGSMDLLVNTIGDYAGTVPNKGYVMLVIETEGTWSVS